MKRIYVVKRDACYLDMFGKNVFSQSKATKFSERSQAQAYADQHAGTSGRVVRVVRRLRKQALVSVAGCANLVLEAADDTEQPDHMILALDRLQRALIAAGIRVPLESNGTTDEEKHG